MPDKTGKTLLKVLKLHEAWCEIDSRKFPDFISRGRVEYGVKAYQSDGAGEICGNNVGQADWMRSRRISHHKTVHDSSQQNGGAEVLGAGAT